MNSLRPPKKKKSNIKVRVFYPSTEEGMEELMDKQACVMLDILESQLGSERFENLMEYAKKKLGYKN